MNKIVQSTVDAWHRGRRIRQTSGGWQSGNAVCCTHRGETADTRGRGGLLVSQTGVSYSCFNCGFKTGYTEGRPLGVKFRKLLNWLGVDQKEIEVLRLEALRHTDEVSIVHQPKVQFNERELPPDIKLLYEAENEFKEQSEYIKSRGFSLDEYPFLATNDEQHKMNKRVIIPFSHNNKIVGYTARLIVPGKPKYYSQVDPAYVFGLEYLQSAIDQQWVALTEGPFDAMCLRGVAVLGSEIREEQAEQIEALQRQIIVVPDRNATGMSIHADKPNSILNTAIDYGWCVSFPDWENDVIDVNEAVKRYGRLYTIKTILDAITMNPVVIKLKARKYSPLK